MAWQDEYIDTSIPRTYTRAEAIELLTRLQDSNDDDEIEPFDFPGMSNDDLEEELCMSGVVHDNDMQGVID